MFRKDLGLADLVSIEEWQKIQESLSEALEITLKTVSVNDDTFTATSRPSRLCTEILSRAHRVNPFCNTCISEKVDKGYISGIVKETRIECPFGLNLFIAPIFAVGDNVVAHIILGPLILKARKNSSEYADEARKLGIDPDTVMDALIEINVFSYSKVYAVISLIKDIFSHVAQTGYHKKRLGEITPEVVQMDPLFSRYYEDKILNSLLNSCTLALNADSGSVMTVDKNTNSLHIKASSKIDSKIVDKTHVKIGEGISGLAALTAKPIILPKDKDKRGLSDKLKRKYIKSSMIVPFNKANTPDVYGVINLNIVRKNVDFSKKDVALIKELVNMASVALVPLREPPEAIE